jgi:hypothetical protein
VVRHATRKRLVRDYLDAHFDMTWTEAQRHLAYAQSAGLVPNAVPLAEQGVHGQPEDADPRHRARAEAIWRPASAPEQPCRCSGRCSHNQPCGQPDCAGHLVHHERIPGSLFEATCWEDVCVCAVCETIVTAFVTLPTLPWGEPTDRGLVVFAGIRHPAFVEFDENDDSGPASGCPDCGADPGYPCVCDRAGCIDCGADSHYQCGCHG